LGNLYYKQNNFDSAIDHYARVIQLDPEYTEAMYNLAQIYEEKDLYSLALGYYEQVLLIHPKDLKVQDRVQYLRNMIERWDETLMNDAPSQQEHPAGNLSSLSASPPISKTTKIKDYNKVKTKERVQKKTNKKIIKPLDKSSKTLPASSDKPPVRSEGRAAVSSQEMTPTVQDESRFLDQMVVSMQIFDDYRLVDPFCRAW